MLPAFPTEVVVDPTGAGDSFAGAMMGYLAKAGRIDLVTLRDAIVYGTVAASYTIGDFSIHGINATNIEAIDLRREKLKQVTQF